MGVAENNTQNSICTNVFEWTMYKMFSNKKVVAREAQIWGDGNRR